jgi:inactivated superfamily I helicase
MTRNTRIALTAFGATLMTLAVVRSWKEYNEIVRKEEEKRKKIDAWMHENLALTFRQRNEILAYVQSDEFEPLEALRRIKEAREFSDFVRNATRPEL